MNLDYEHEVQGPFVNPKFPKQVYWKSEATTLTAILYDQDELKEKDILKYLQDIKMEGIGNVIDDVPVSSERKAEINE